MLWKGNAVEATISRTWSILNGFLRDNSPIERRKKMLSLKNRSVRNLLAGILTAVLVVTGTQAAFAESEQAKDQIHDQIIALGVTAYSPEYYAFTHMWSDYFLDLLPDSSQPEALQRLTLLPNYDDLKTWRDFFHDGNHILMRDTAYSVAKELDIDSQSLSTAEKIQRITGWTESGRSWQESAFGRVGDFDGYTYDCTTQSEGLVTLFRIAGIPAISISMVKSTLHEDPFFYDGSEWRGAFFPDRTFAEYFQDIRAMFINGTISYTPEDTYLLEHMVAAAGYGYFDYILDINESWVDSGMEAFMIDLVGQPYAYPNQKLTRGEVAKLVCNYLYVVPMRNEKVFSDVPTSHKYSKYIWAMNKLGIMTGDGGTFRPDSELSMQEFAVIALRIVEYSLPIAASGAEKSLKSILENPTDWPPDLEYTKEVVQDYEEKLDWRARFAEIFERRPPTVFADNGNIASWAKSAVDKFSSAGILQGNGNGYLLPTESLSKTRFLVFLSKLNITQESNGFKVSGGAIF
ncbi:MAG: S-layer homology domain-containing protein [Candidatus Nomurabacteria bacterium]|nr:S-layer homology domain-containing protein [Candidatus Nomurabacteria bacterium]